MNFTPVESSIYDVTKNMLLCRSSARKMLNALGVCYFDLLAYLCVLVKWWLQSVKFDARYSRWYWFHFRGSCMREGVMVMFYLTQKVAPFVDIYAIWGNDWLLPFLCGFKLSGAFYLLAMPVTANLTSYICSTVSIVSFKLMLINSFGFFSWYQQQTMRKSVWWDLAMHHAYRDNCLFTS